MKGFKRTDQSSQNLAQWKFPDSVFRFSPFTLDTLDGDSQDLRDILVSLASLNASYYSEGPTLRVGERMLRRSHNPGHRRLSWMCSVASALSLDIAQAPCGAFYGMFHIYRPQFPRDSRHFRTQGVLRSA